MTISFEEDASATVTGEVAKLLAATTGAAAGSVGPAGAATDARVPGVSGGDGSAGGAGSGSTLHQPKKRIRQSFRVDGPGEGGAEEGVRRDGSSFATYSLGTFSVAPAKRREGSRWGDESPALGRCDPRVPCPLCPPLPTPNTTLQHNAPGGVVSRASSEMGRASPPPLRAPPSALFPHNATLCKRCLPASPAVRVPVLPFFRCAVCALTPLTVPLYV
jgi:hypothetical protein